MCETRGNTLNGRSFVLREFHTLRAEEKFQDPVELIVAGRIHFGRGLIRELDESFGDLARRERRVDHPFGDC